MKTAQNRRRLKLEAEARVILLERRRQLSSRLDRGTREAEELYGEREPDWEDRAANVAAAVELAHVSEIERAQLMGIGAALERLEAGAYGHCVACGHEIAEDRLHAMPEAARCARCAEKAAA
jgi:RNA polymerase-binding transcription factor DksA